MFVVGMMKKKAIKSIIW